MGNIKNQSITTLLLRREYACTGLRPLPGRGKDGENAAIKAYDISEAERDGTLEYTASVYDFMNDQIIYDFSIKGPRIVDFSKILQYDYFPLAPTLQILLNIFSQAMGSPVEIEFSINFENNTPVFYLLQIKPLIKNEYNIDIDDLSIDPTHVLLKADKGMGNGNTCSK